MARQERYIPDFVFDNLDGLDEAVKSKGYSTMKEVAIKAGLAPDYLCGLKSGIFSPTRNSYNKIAPILGWEVWE